MSDNVSLGDAVDIVATYLAVVVRDKNLLRVEDVEPWVPGWGVSELETLRDKDMPDDIEAPPEALHEGFDPKEWWARRDPRVYSEAWPLDMAFFKACADAPEYAITRYRTVTPREYRGKFGLARFAVECGVQFLTKAGRCSGTAQHYAVFQRDRWVDVRIPGTREQPDGLVAWTTGEALGLQALRTCEWRVSVGFEGAPSAMLSMGPAGIREMFRLRDLPNGKKRRAALRHWVSQHWRRREGAEEAAAVRAYLRGVTDFRWNGLCCRVHLPEPERDMYAPKVREAPQPPVQSGGAA